ncbi:GRASP55/65 PDZ-like domain-containing protein [Cristinia sonorae]|uniref:GRASP55/65 PDZ-like domain-containing protein n=1 Tax=Cristinia sonorae TaxID=1940300 RepID=A0A8K0UUH0_9AGAR|nr:GRASP55/65 PDZ-like domain-containing protein [Cristinia sonorae]
MGAGQSTASQIPPRGLHVLRVTPLSPASETTIEPFFDFVIGFQGDTSNPSNAGMINAEELEKIVEKHEGRPLNLFVWNSKNQNTRVVPIVPSRAWSMPHLDFSEAQGQESDPDRKPSLLGLSMRMCAPETSMDNVWHVLDVLEGSPAESAGLVPYGDWIIGWSGGVLSVESDFYEVVEAHVEKPLRVYVYSYDFDNIREVVLVPNRHWGGEGLLGCVFGFGLLHRIPPLPENREPGSIPPELLESAEEYEDQQLFVPADETPEQAQERMRWEHEEWERENYARNYVHDESESAANHTPALYVGSVEHSHEDHTHGPDTKHAQHIQSIHDTLYHAHEDGDRHDHDTNHDGSESQDTNPPIERHPVVAPVPVRPAFRPHSFSESAGRRTPVAASRVSSFTLPRVATPTQSRPFGSLMNGWSTTPFQGFD